MTEQEALNEAHRITKQSMLHKRAKGETMSDVKVDMQDIQKLREITKASISDCKSALEATKTIEEAIDWLAKKGIVDGLRLSGESKEGACFSYIHTNQKVGVLLDLGCQTDFVAKTDEFKALGRDICLHIAGSSPFPRFVDEKETVSSQLEIDQLKPIMDKTLVEKGFSEDAKRESIPDKQWEMIVKIATGRLSKWRKEICLLSQKFVKDPTITIGDLVNKLSGLTKEKIVVRKFTRYEI